MNRWVLLYGCTTRMKFPQPCWKTERERGQERSGVKGKVKAGDQRGTSESGFIALELSGFLKGKFYDTSQRGRSAPRLREYQNLCRHTPFLNFISASHTQEGGFSEVWNSEKQLNIRNDPRRSGGSRLEVL